MPTATTKPRLAKRAGSQSLAVEAFALRVRESASRVWQEALRLEALGLDAEEAWGRYRAILERGFVLTGLLGAAASQRRLRARGLAPEVPEQPMVRGVPGSPEDETAFEAVSLRGAVHAPFWEAVDVFRREIPGLQSIFDDLLKASESSVGAMVEKERATALPEFRERVMRAAAKPAPGASPLVREATPQQIAAAVDASLGVQTAKARTDTVARTLTMEAFNAGSYRDMARAGVYVAFELREIHDTRTRGNPHPNALYPGTGPHWQMDRFVAAKDDPIWRRIWPPNGYNCRATVLGLTKQDMQRAGFWIDGQGGGMLDRVQLQAAYARQRKYVEDGLYPDKGFDRNLGASLG